MRRTSWSGLWRGMVVLILVAAPASAVSGWWHDSPLKIRAHDHQFYRVSANAVDCTVRVRLHFDAPANQYRSSDAALNYYRFASQVKMAGGYRFESRLIANSKPGPRVISFSQDTSSEGCWARRVGKVRKVNVRSCRGKGCQPRPF